MGKYGGSTVEYFVRKAMPSDLYPTAYNLQLIKSIDELKQVLSFKTDFISFDTETNGLNFEECDICGYSFCMNGKDAYYVAVGHAVGTYNLGEEALDLIYEKMCNTKTVMMFNMRFDCRIMEWHGYTTSDLPLEERNNKVFFKYDMSKVNVMDIQAMVWLADTSKKYISLKWSEEWFLGWRGASFEDTLEGAENFYYLDPMECYTYAATDALGTYLLYPKVYPFYQDAMTSGQLDNQFLMSLMRYEQELIEIDTEMLTRFSEDIQAEMQQVEKECWSIAGYPFNLSSGKEKSSVLTRLGVSTGEKTKRGEWKTGADVIEVALENMDKSDINYGFLEKLVKYATLKKQLTSYVDNIIEMAAGNKYHPGKLRFNYKTTEVPSGRLAAGGDKKSTFFAFLNIQNITKPHVQDWFYLPLNILLEHWPDIKNFIFDENGVEKREWVYKKRTITKDGVDTEVTYTMTHILGYVFSDKPFEIDGVQEYIIEGFKQNRNIRSAFVPDNDKYWVSIDYAAEEIRVPTIITKEPVWMKTFCNGGDVHHETALAIWGPENYNKDLRKIAKGANFGILYGQNEYNFAHHFDGDVAKAKDFIDNFKGTLSTLFGWVAFHQREAQKNGYVRTYFGRPVRLKTYFDSQEYGRRSYGKRLAVNATIQGTGADILKIAFLKLWGTLMGNPANRNKIKFCSTIHDEINYQISKRDAISIVPMVIKCMRLQLPDWEFPMDVGLEIGNRWGMTFAFKFDPNDFHIIGPKGDPYIKKEDATEEIEEVVEEIEEDSFEMPSVEY